MALFVFAIGMSMYYLFLEYRINKLMQMLDHIEKKLDRADNYRVRE